MKLKQCIRYTRGSGSSVGIATGYGLDGPGVESRLRGGDFPHLSRPALGPTQPRVKWSFPGVKSDRGVLLTTHPLLVPRSWKSKTIPLPPSGPYDLYRASVPVQGRILPVLLYDAYLKFFLQGNPEEVQFNSNHFYSVLVTV